MYGAVTIRGSNRKVLLAFGRPFVKRFALLVTVICMSCLVMSCPVMSVCLSVTFVHCGQTVGRIKMKLGLQVGLPLATMS